ncbi:uncharacterized protein LOC133200461 [Saccostrea echinata]|uniref:uncharacterized protein LOC133200461 n=1 Tax=Saccostrea echinata TaxID=191078 RepID=UPI002A8159AA|nr:uncharacterized protein LOC133200461 [Saccostrea echinata]
MKMHFALFTTVATAVVLLTVSTIYINGEECKESESKKTAVRVESCPRSSREWEKAAARKGCNTINPSTSCHFEYHCVINAWKNETIEVCAPGKVIVGKVCAEYSFGGSRIQRNYAAKCHGCPDSYNSNESLKYSECYDLVSNARKTSRPVVTTTPSTLETTITTDSITPLALSNQKQVSTEQEPKSDLDIEIIIPICIGIAAIIIFILICLVQRSRKKCFFIEDILSKSCRFWKREKRSNPHDNTNKDTENTPLKEETTEHCLVKIELSSEEQQLGETCNV